LIVSYFISFINNQSVCVMNCDARGRGLRGFEVDLWEIRVASYSTHGSTVSQVLFTPRVVVAARVGGAQGTPAMGLRPRPTREKGFPSNILIDLIDTSPLLMQRGFLDP
jgi:hypothetical protein